MRSIERWVLGIILGGVLAGAACTSTPRVTADAAADGTAVADGGTAAPVTCDGLIRHQEMCGRLGDAGDMRDLLCADLEKARVKWRPDFFATLYGCFINHACFHDDEDCLGLALATAPETLVDHAALAQCLQDDGGTCPSFARGASADCLARRAACQTEAGASGFSDDLCITVAALNDESLGSVPSCLAGPCDQLRSCLVALGSFTY